MHACGANRGIAAGIFIKTHQHTVVAHAIGCTLRVNGKAHKVAVEWCNYFSCVGSVIQCAENLTLQFVIVHNGIVSACGGIVVAIYNHTMRCGSVNMFCLLPAMYVVLIVIVAHNVAVKGFITKKVVQAVRVNGASVKVKHRIFYHRRNAVLHRRRD